MTLMPLSLPLPRLVLALLLAVPLTACGGEDPVPSGERPITVPADNPDVASAVADPSTPRIVSIVVTDDRLTGDTGIVEIRRNAPVRLVVISDEADTVVVEGYDLTALATAEAPLQLDFIADQPGTFRVVLRQSGTQLTTLKIS
jgi:hypothetical protein